MKKHDVLALLRAMPEDIDTDDLMYRLSLRQTLAAAEATAETGAILSHDAVMRRSDEWLQKPGQVRRLKISVRYTSSLRETLSSMPASWSGASGRRSLA